MGDVAKFRDAQSDVVDLFLTCRGVHHDDHGSFRTFRSHPRAGSIARAQASLVRLLVSRVDGMEYPHMGREWTGIDRFRRLNRMLPLL